MITTAVVRVTTTHSYNHRRGSCHHDPLVHFKIAGEKCSYLINRYCIIVVVVFPWVLIL